MRQYIYNNIKDFVKFFIGGGKFQCFFRVVLWQIHYRLRYGTSSGFIIGRNNRFDTNNRVLFRKEGTILIGDDNHIQRNGRIVIEGGHLQLGNHCTFGEENIFNVFGNITFGDYVLTADRVSFIGNIHQYVDTNIPIKMQPTTCDNITIGSGTWLGINSVVLAGTTIGKNCVVAANAVVKGTFPDNCVIAGLPARVVKHFDKETNKWIR